MVRATRSSPWAAYGALALGVACIGCSAIFVKLADVPGATSAFYRLFFAALAFAPWGLARGARRLGGRPTPGPPPSGPPKTRDLALIGIGALCFAFDLLLWNSALLLTSAATATLLANNAPLWVGLIAWLVFGERLSGRYWLGLLLALGGMALIVGPAAWGSLGLRAGELLAIGASLLYAGYLVTTGQVRARVGTLPFMTLSVSIGAAVLFVTCLAMGAPLTGFSAKSWAALIGLGLISQLAGWLVINYALGHLPAHVVSVTLLGQAVVTALLAIPVLRELPTALQLGGGALVLAGIALVTAPAARAAGAAQESPPA